MKQTHNLAVKKYSTVNFKKLWTENIHPSVRPSQKGYTGSRKYSQLFTFSKFCYVMALFQIDFNKSLSTHIPHSDNVKRFS